MAELEQAQESYHSNNCFTDSDDDDDDDDGGDDDDDDACDSDDELGSAVVDFGSQLAPLFGGVMTHLLSK